MYGHFISKTVLSSTMPSGDAPRIPEESNQIPVSFTDFPVLRVNALMASSSLSTPHWIALTLDKLYSLRRHFRSEGVTLLALRTEPKLLALSRPLLAICHTGLFLWPTVISLILMIFCSSSVNCKPNNPTALKFL